MSTERFYIKKFVRRNGSFVSDGDAIDLEEDYPGLRYKSVTGLDAYGEPQTYTESFAEDEETMVYLPDESIRKQTDVTLSLYFFGADPSVATSASDEVLRDAAMSLYRQFMEDIENSFLCYWDNVRKRKVMLYDASATSVKGDLLYGTPYINVELKFKNVYGRSFSLDGGPFETVTI